MPVSLAILSGKGGSGKTILSISLALLLAACEYRVLLIDCDIATHSSAYFFKDHPLNRQSNGENSIHIHTTHELMYGSDMYPSTINPLKVSSNFDFIPSRVDFLIDHPQCESISKSRFDHIFNYNLAKDYDIIIYDCQSGYSVVTELVLQYTHRVLTVIEADLISKYALLTLKDKFKQLSTLPTYQVFNKVTEKEYDLYSKLHDETIFTNLTPIIFHWSIKGAFVRNQLPSMDATNLMLTNSIYLLAVDLFPEHKHQLHSFALNLMENAIKDSDDKLKDIKEKRKNYNLGIAISAMFIVLALSLISIASIFPDIFSLPFALAFLISLMMTIALASGVLIVFSQKNKAINKERSVYIDKRKKLETALYEVTEKLKCTYNTLEEISVP